MAPQAGIRGCKVSLIESVDGSEGPSERGWLSPTRAHATRATHLGMSCCTLTLTHPSLIAKWKRSGYENLCCTRCIQSKVGWSGVAATALCSCSLALGGPTDMARLFSSFSLQDMNNEGSTCICRVPKAQLKGNQTFECPHCGCRGCASGD